MYIRTSFVCSSLRVSSIRIYILITGFVDPKCNTWLLWGACMVAPGGGGHAWLLLGGMHGCSGEHVWLLRGGHAWLLWGGWVCVVALGGMRGCSRGVCVVFQGGGMHGFSGGAWFFR